MMKIDPSTNVLCMEHTPVLRSASLDLIVVLYSIYDTRWEHSRFIASNILYFVIRRRYRTSREKWHYW